MNLLVVTVHGLAVAMMNIAAILFGFMVYSVVRPANQIAVQAPVAVLMSITAVLFWAWLSRRPWQGRHSLAAVPPVWVFFAALVWLPLIFLPLHLITQGYLSSFDNILAGWVFQAPVNALALAMVRMPFAKPRHILK